MKIPNDTAGEWRLNKFIEYQHYCWPITMTDFIPKDFTADEILHTLWLFSLVYNETTPFVIVKELDIIQKYPDIYWQEMKPILRFNSAKARVKNMDKFIPAVQKWLELTEGNVYEWILQYKNDIEGLKKAYLSLPQCGEFSWTLYIDELCEYCRRNEGIHNFDIHKEWVWDFKNGSNMTSGLLNIFYFDEEADLFDKTGELVFSESDMIQMVNFVIESIKETYNLTEVKPKALGKLCSWRNLFKANRYGGFHYDRQLEDLLWYKDRLENQELIEHCFNVRKRVIHNHLLGELHGWMGVRKERKKLWTTQGLTGCELT
jgi:hypothetical protein